MKDDLKNLFIIGTPLQLINAMEALKHFNLENNILVIVHRSLDANRVQIDNLISLFKWDNIMNIEYSRSSSMLKYIALVKDLKQYSYNYIFISKLEVVPKIVIPNVIKKKVFLLDDGTLTLPIYEKHIKTNKLNRYDFKELRFLLFGLKIKIRDKINLFTYFDLEPVHGIEVIKNELTYLKDTYLKNATKDNNVIYFIGQATYGIIGIDSYIGNLEKIMRKNKKVIYIPHRAETEKALIRLSAIEGPLFTIKEIGIPIELYFLQNSIYPTSLISYYSTALTTLGIIYNECDVKAIQIPYDDETSNNSLRACYEIFDDNQIISIEDLGI